MTVLITGTYDTDIITDAGTTDDRDFNGPYARHAPHDEQPRPVRDEVRAKSPERFADGLAKALADTGPFRRRAVGPDASMLLVSNRIAAGRGHAPHVAAGDGHPRQGAMRDGACR